METIQAYKTTNGKLFDNKIDAEREQQAIDYHQVRLKVCQYVITELAKNSCYNEYFTSVITKNYSKAKPNARSVIEQLLLQNTDLIENMCKHIKLIKNGII